MRMLAFLLLLLAAPLAAQDFPKLTGRVVDTANILPPETEAAIEARSAAIETQTGAQLVVATVPSLQGYEIEDYGYRLGRTWGIGQKRGATSPTGEVGGDNGVILIVAPNDRKVRVEVGYGLEPILTDALSSVIIQQQILPRFREGDMATGVLNGFEAIAKQVELPPEEAALNVQRATETATEDSGGGIGGFIFLLFLLLWVWIAFRRGKNGRRRGAGPIVIWGPGMGGGSGWGGGGGGWGGGGGFGGGGGGFGGGGASGGW